MAITVKELQTLIYLKRNGFLKSKASVIDIGAQQIANNFLQAKNVIQECADIFQLENTLKLPVTNQSTVVHGVLEHLDTSAVHARAFWEWLGYQYSVIDIDNSPGIIPLDLNYESTPIRMVKAFDLVTNFGTTEHLVNQLNAFKVIHELTKVGGIMMHALPAQGMMNHGLINYNPKFFWMLARSNGYKWVYSDYTTSMAYYNLPQNVVDCMLPYNPNILKQSEGYQLADCGLVVVLQKLFDTPYVPALDVPTGTQALNSTLENRYWSVFKDDAFKRFDPHEKFTMKLIRRLKMHLSRILY